MPDAPAAGAKGEVRKANMEAIISFVCCFYGMYWSFLRIKEINNYLGRPVVNPIFAFLPVLMILAYWKICEVIPEVQKKAGLEGKDEKLVDFLSMFLCAPYGVFRLQNKLNEVWSK